jgi:hypothetical protein
VCGRGKPHRDIECEDVVAYIGEFKILAVVNAGGLSRFLNSWGVADRRNSQDPVTAR